MNTATIWEQKHRQDLTAMAEAIQDKDTYLAEEILNTIAPRPEGENVQEGKNLEHRKSGRQAKVVDPITGRIDNPHGVAVVEADGTRKWYRANMLHNAHGPAIIKPNGKLSYYHFGTRCKSAAALDAVTQSTKRHNDNATDYHNSKTEALDL
ncbi:MAG: hypothetical protein COB46_00830 [Rhodospirillaceae bacterium]|nr:MAG: hypothetical protein COB46_00830 [Rhodospirillaceae bacterium]